MALWQTSDMLELAVRDDGVGFDPDTVLHAAAQGEGFGLLGMQERVEQLGGRAEIQFDQVAGRASASSYQL